MVDVKAGGQTVRPAVGGFVKQVQEAHADGKLTNTEERRLKDAFKGLSSEEKDAAIALVKNSGYPALASHLDPAAASKPGLTPEVRATVDAGMVKQGIPADQRGRILDRFDKLDSTAAVRQWHLLEATVATANPTPESKQNALARYEKQLGSLVDGTPRTPGPAGARPQVTGMELERQNAQDKLVKQGGTSVVFMTGKLHQEQAEREIPGWTMQRANQVNQDQAAVASTTPNQPAQVALSNTSVGDVKQNLANMAAEHARKGEPSKGFAREVYLIGHGTPGAWQPDIGKGGKPVDAEALRNVRTGELSDAMANGGTVTLGGCEMAQGKEGRELMKEVGRVFFGEGKTGYIRGGTKETNDPTHPVDAVVLKWPDDFR